MEKYQMNRSCARPYQATCGMNRQQMMEPGMSRQTARTDRMNEEPCGCHMSGISPAKAAFYARVDCMPVAMAYVPCQKFTECFDPCRALHAGTIFPDLCKPFCGKRGVKR